jgi:hypothetical protein
LNWTVHSAAPEWGIDRKTLRRRLVDAGHDLVKRKEFTTREISEAIYGDERLEKIKGQRLENELSEIEIGEKRGLLMSQSDAMAVINSWGVPIRQKLIALASELKHRVNPIDPDLAGKVLAEWTKQFMRLIQSEIPRISAETNAALVPAESDAPESTS